MEMYTVDDFMHTPTNDPGWQESVLLIFYDEESGLTGFIHPASLPNVQLSQVHLNFATRDGLRYRNNLHDLPMQKNDRTPEGFAAGGIRWRIPDKKYVRVTVDEKDCSADLRLYNWFPSTSWHIHGIGDMSTLAQGHIESSGRVEGVVRIGNETFDIKNAFGHRDHSWGFRDATIIRSFRWVAGTTGPELSFSFNMLHLSQGQFMKMGWICRNGKIQHVKDVEIISYVTSDGLTHKGGYVIATLPDGEVIRIDAEIIDGFITSYRSEKGGQGSHVGVEGMCKIKSGDRKGFCDFNIANCITGTEKECAGIREEYATLTNGISKRPPRPL
jgi:hypothetical protein